MDDWENDEWENNLPKATSADDLKSPRNDETEEVVESDEELVISKLDIYEAKVVYSEDPEVINIYCGEFVSGKGKKKKNFISVVLIDNEGKEIISSQKYLGENVDILECRLKCVLLGLREIISLRVSKKVFIKYYKKIHVYASYEIPALNKIIIKDFINKEDTTKREYKSRIKDLVLYKTIVIPTKDNVAINIAKKAYTQLKEAGAKNYKNNKEKIKGEKAFNSRRR